MWWFVEEEVEEEVGVSGSKLVGGCWCWNLEEQAPFALSRISRSRPHQIETPDKSRLKNIGIRDSGCYWSLEWSPCPSDHSQKNNAPSHAIPKTTIHPPNSKFCLRCRTRHSDRHRFLLSS